MKRLAAGVMALALMAASSGTGTARAAGPKAYGGLFKDDAVAVIDTTTDRVVGQIAVPQVHNATIAPDGRRAWVASQKQGATALAILDLQTYTQVGAVPLDKTPRALDVSPDGKRVYFTLAGVNA